MNPSVVFDRLLTLIVSCSEHSLNPLSDKKSICRTFCTSLYDHDGVENMN